MAKANKYQARSVYWNVETQTVVDRASWSIPYQKSGKLPPNIVYFASTFEFKVYQALVDLYGVNSVIHQYPLPIISKCKCYPLGQDWRIDFAIKPSIKEAFPTMLVEAKGYPTETFTKNLAFLEQTNPTAFERFYLLFHKAIPKGNKLIKNLLSTDVKDRILTLSQFVRNKATNEAYRV